MTTAAPTPKPAATPTDTDPPLAVPMIFAHKPTVTKAMPFVGTNGDAINAWVAATAKKDTAKDAKDEKPPVAMGAATHKDSAAHKDAPKNGADAKKTMSLQTPKGQLPVEQGDWVVLGVDQQAYVLTAQQFEDSYAHID